MQMNENTFTVIISTFLILLLCVLVRLIIVLPACNVKQFNKEPFTTNNNVKNTKLTILLGSGGHTGEMIRILEQWGDKLNNFNRQYVISSGDSTSIHKLQKLEETTDNKDYQIDIIHRANNIGSNKLSSLINTLISFKSTFNHIIYQKWRGLPEVFLTNGPGTAIPIAYLLFICKFLGVCDTKIIYIESLARVNDLSLTGFLILPISDRIIVQWEPLSKKYKRCEYHGILI